MNTSERMVLLSTLSLCESLQPQVGTRQLKPYKLKVDTITPVHQKRKTKKEKARKKKRGY